MGAGPLPPPSAPSAHARQCWRPWVGLPGLTFPGRGEGGQGQSGIHEDTRHVPGTHPRAVTDAVGVGRPGQWEELGPPMP